MRWREVIGATVLALTLAPAAASGAATGDGRAAPGLADQAMVQVETPSLPLGDSRAARSERKRLRQRSSELLGAVARRNALSIVDRIPETGQLAVEIDGESVAELRRRLASDPRVERVLPVPEVELRHTANDFAFVRRDPNAPGADFFHWNLIKSGGPAAWDLSRGVGAEVAVIDTGAAVSHPDLAGRIAATLDCSGGCGGTNVTDPVGHGTHVAGLACGDSDNGYGITSLGFDCNLFIVRIGDSCDDAAAAVVAAANRGSDAINMSFGGCGPEMAPALTYAYGRGSVLVAAGDNRPAPPPTYPSQGVQPEGTGPNLDAGRGVVVTAAKYNGTRAAFAQATSGVSMAAFGAASDRVSGGQQGILSTFPPPALVPLTYEGFGIRTSLNGDNRFAYLVGTSMAAPQVAGVAALMRGVNPGLAASRVARLLKLTASHCGQYVAGLGWGLVDAYRAVSAAADRDITVPSSEVKRAGFDRLRIKRADGACHAELPSSGVKVVRIYASKNGGEYRKVRKTKKKFIEFRGKKGKRYRFYTVAVDQAGNEESAPPEPDMKRRGRGPEKRKNGRPAKRP